MWTAQVQAPVTASICPRWGVLRQDTKTGLAPGAALGELNLTFDLLWEWEEKLSPQRFTRAVTLPHHFLFIRLSREHQGSSSTTHTQCKHTCLLWKSHLIKCLNYECKMHPNVVINHTAGIQTVDEYEIFIVIKHRLYFNVKHGQKILSSPEAI